MAPPKRLASLQILRALAAWTVVFHHYVQIFLGPTLATGIAGFFWQHGALGVDVFFVLSGFVMCLVVQGSKKGPVAFMVDRVFRLAPAYWFLSAVVIAGIYLFPTGFSATDFTAATLLQSALFIPSKNPVIPGMYPVLTVGWTLNFEMFFYAALACCMALSKKWCVPVLLALFSLVPLIYPYNGPLSVIVLSPLLHEFSAGVVLALLWTKGLEKHIAGSSLWTLAGACLFVVFGWFWMVTGKSPTVFALSIVSCALVLDRRLPRDSAWVRGLVHLGDLSYSTYLAHCVVMWIILDFTGKNLSPAYHAAALALTIAGTYVFARWSYRWLENGKHVKEAQAAVTRALTVRRPVVYDEEALSEVK